MGLHYLFIHLCHCPLLVCSPLLSSLLGGLFPSPNSPPLCFHGPIYVCICVYEIPMCIYLTEEDAVICLPPFISSESLSPSISTMSSLYFHCIFIYMYACVCVKFTSRSHRWDVRENMLYLYAESHLFQSASIFSSVQLSCKWHYNIIFNIVYVCWVVDVLENSIQLSVTALLLSENMHSALTCLGIYLDSHSVLVPAFLLFDLMVAFAHGWWWRWWRVYGVRDLFSCYIFSPVRKLLSRGWKENVDTAFLLWGYWAMPASFRLSSNLWQKQLSSLVLLTWRVRCVQWVKSVYQKSVPFVWSFRVLIFIHPLLLE